MKDVNFSMEEGERVGLVGPSGYGKSTLVKLLAGYLEPCEGEILLDGKPMEKKGVCPVQLIYQHPEKAINPRWKMKKVLEESGMYRELSGGELQRFCVARSLFEGTHFLLADEMSTMLDVITQAQIWNLMLREVEKRKIGLLAVTHNMALADCVCTRTINLAQVNHIKCAEESGCKNGCEYGTV